MNRREFLLRSPKTSRNQAEFVQVLGLEPYTGEWTFKQASHLLRRTMFGATKQDTESILPLSMTQAVDKLLASSPDPSEPVTYTNSGNITQGKPWTSAPYEANSENQRLTFVQSWWIEQMLNQAISLREKMVLFWHNHSACGGNTVKDVAIISPSGLSSLNSIAPPIPPFLAFACTEAIISLIWLKSILL